MPDPTLTEALDHLAGSLPENPGLDTEHQRALRVVVGECESLPVRLPWEERLDPEWFAREGDVEDTLRTARSVLARVHHPDTGMYGLLSALVLNLERAGAIAREPAEDWGPPLPEEVDALKVAWESARRQALTEETPAP